MARKIGIENNVSLSDKVGIHNGETSSVFFQYIGGADKTYTWPSNDGYNSNALMTNGSGQLYFGTVSSTGGPTGSTGSTGAKGATGQGFTYTGDWIYTRSYLPYDVVSDHGSSYVCITANSNSQPMPDNSNSRWNVIALAGLDGTQGTGGSSGTSGTDGTSGTTGTSGTSGINGTMGVSGTNGTSGTSAPGITSGTSGSAGTSGLTGTSGTSGTNGLNGTMGPAGSSGTSGLFGTSGTSGTRGTSGTTGTSGTSAVAGSSGTSGINGTFGTSGINGTSGSTGTSGTSGTTGTSGTSAVAGSSGTSGSSGPAQSGTQNYVSKFINGVSALGDSGIYQNSNEVSFNMSPYGYFRLYANSQALYMQSGTQSGSSSLPIVFSTSNSLVEKFKIDVANNTSVFGLTNSLSNQTFFTKSVNHTPTIATITTSTYSVDMSASNIFILTLTSSTTLSTSNRNVGSYMVYVKQDATGGRLLTLSTDGQFVGATAISIGTASNALSVIQLVCLGTYSHATSQKNLINL